MSAILWPAAEATHARQRLGVVRSPGGAAAPASPGAGSAGWPDARTPSPRRRHLVSVPTGDWVPEREPPFRLTRRGRLTLLGLAVLLGCVFALGVALAPGSPASAAHHAVTVRPGDTLSEIAVREMPRLPIREAVARIQIANDLPGPHISAGQSLVIPKS